MPLLLPALCEALARAGVQIAVDTNARCIAVPVESVTPAMFDGLKRYKLEILRALRSKPLRTLCTIRNCPRCGSDVVLRSADLCGTCASIAPRRLSIEPESRDERTVLHAISSRTELSQTVPTPSNTPLGTVGTVGTVKQGNHIHVRALEEKVKTA